MKALGAGIRQGLWFRQIEVATDPQGSPRLRLRRRALARFRQLGAERVEAAVTRFGPLVVALVWVGAAAPPGAAQRPATALTEADDPAEGLDEQLRLADRR